MLPLSTPSILSISPAVSPLLSILPICAWPIAWVVPSQDGPELGAQGLGPPLPSPALLQRITNATSNVSLSLDPEPLGQYGRRHWEAAGNCMCHHSRESITLPARSNLFKAPRKQIRVLVRGAEAVIITSSILYLSSTCYMLSTGTGGISFNPHDHQ